MIPQKIKKRHLKEHPCLSEKRTYSCGSLTVEAALVMPLFLFAVISLLSVLDMLRTYMHTEMKLYNSARDLALISYSEKPYTTGLSSDEDWIRLKLVYPARSRGGSLFAHTLILENHVNVHIFNGYSGDRPKGDTKTEQEYVYVTEDSSVYHRSRGCSHLKVTIREVSYGSIGSLRSSDGSKYYLCPHCGRGMTKRDLAGMTVYASDYGNRFHTSRSCSHLKRTVRRIPLSQAGGRRPCLDCG
ncbi:MAG: pilus assembly protein [Lachnospiraceae bacterium]|nr:pilus assembly protein [Lachnospiraceae bacterium]